MKNPYRQFLQIPLRSMIFATMGPLFLGKFLVFILFVNDSPSLPMPWHSPWPAVAIALSGIPDLLVIYYLSAGWYDLDRRPWVILPSPLLHFLGGAGLAALAAKMVMDAGAFEALSRKQLMVAAGAAAVLLLGVTQLIASLKLHNRVRPRRAGK